MSQFYNNEGETRSANCSDHTAWTDKSQAGPTLHMLWSMETRASGVIKDDIINLVLRTVIISTHIFCAYRLRLHRSLCARARRSNASIISSRGIRYQQISHNRHRTAFCSTVPGSDIVIKHCASLSCASRSLCRLYGTREVHKRAVRKRKIKGICHRAFATSTVAHRCA